MSETTKKSWRPGVLTWLIIVGVVLINVAVFFLSGSSRAWSIFAYYFNPWHWPLFYALNLWIIASGLLIDYFLRLTKIHVSMNRKPCFLSKRTVKFNRNIFWLVLIAVAVTDLFFVPWKSFSFLLRIFYYDFYFPYLQGPLSTFLSEGDVSWKLFILPIFFIATVSLLLIFRKKKAESRHEK